MSKRMTVKEFLAQIRRDGLPKAIGAEFRNINKFVWNEAWYMYPDSTLPEEVVIGSACAMGQGFINAGVKPPKKSETYIKLYGVVSRLNDYYSYSIEQIADLAEESLRPVLNRTITFEEYDYSRHLTKAYKPKDIP